jgi:hypothetical protein
MTRANPGWRDIVLAILGGVVLVSWNLYLGFRQFGGDGSVLFNAAWLEYLGRAPYADFKTACPPLFLFPLGAAFHAGGVSWTSLVQLLTAFSLLLYVWQVALFRRMGSALWYAVACALVLQAVTILPSSWWWYNPLTGAVEAMLVAATIFLLLRPGDILVRASFIAAEILVALAKINTAAPLLAGLLLLLLVRRETRWFALGASLVTVAIVLLLFHAEGTTPGLYLANVHASGARAFSLPMWRMCLMGLGATDFALTAQVVVVLAVCVPLLVRARVAEIADVTARRSLAASLFCVVLIALGIFLIGGITNNDLKLIDAACLVMTALCLGNPAGLVLSPRGRTFAAVTAFFLLALAADGLVLGWSRHRVLNMGYGQFWETGPLTTIEAPPAFRGMVTGLRFREMAGEVSDAVRMSRATQGSASRIFIGFRIDCMYAALGIGEPRGLPLWWENVPSSHLGAAYPTYSNLPAYWDAPARWLRPGEPFDPRTQAFFAARFETCIFWRSYLHHADMAYLPSEIRADLHDHYALDNHYPLIVVYRLK